MKYKEKTLFPDTINVPVAAFCLIWLLTCIYLNSNVDAADFYYVNIIPVFPGVRDNVFCYSMEDSLSSFLLMLAWLFSFLVLIAVLFMSRDYRKFYLRASKVFENRKKDKENKLRHAQWALWWIFGFIIIFPYSRYMFGVNIFPVECSSYPGSHLFPGKSFAVDGLWIIFTGYILGALFSFFIGKILVKTNGKLN